MRSRIFLRPLLLFASILAVFLTLTSCDSSSGPEAINCPIEPVSYFGEQKSDSRTLMYVRVENTSDDDIKIKSGSATWEFEDVKYFRNGNLGRPVEEQDYRVNTQIETIDQKLVSGLHSLANTWTLIG